MLTLMRWITVLVAMSFSGAALATPNCPAQGAKFKRNNAGFETVLVSQGGAGEASHDCSYLDTASNRVARFTLTPDDRPLDAVPKSKDGLCPRKAKAEYTFVITTYQDEIAAGPDAAGRCLVRSQRFGEQWMYPDQFKLIGSSGDADAEARIDLSGTWRCSANGNIPIATLEFGWFNKRYTLKDTPNPQWKPKSGKLNGSGSIKISDTSLVPGSGPLVSELGVQHIRYAVDRGQRALYLQNKSDGLALLQCLPAS